MGSLCCASSFSTFHTAKTSDVVLEKVLPDHSWSDDGQEIVHALVGSYFLMHEMNYQAG